MKTLKVGIASYGDMKARTMAVARGELRPRPGDPKVWFTSPETFSKLLSNRNRALLAQIADTHPASLHDLAIKVQQGVEGGITARHANHYHLLITEAIAEGKWAGGRPLRTSQSEPDLAWGEVT